MSMKTATLLAAIAAGIGLLQQILILLDLYSYYRMFSFVGVLIGAAYLLFFVTLYNKQNGK